MDTCPKNVWDSKKFTKPTQKRMNGIVPIVHMARKKSRNVVQTFLSVSKILSEHKCKLPH